MYIIDGAGISQHLAVASNFLNAFLDRIRKCAVDGEDDLDEVVSRNITTVFSITGLEGIFCIF